MKKSFILYLDQQDLFNKLPDEVAGKLIKHIFSYVNCEDPETDDLLIDIAFQSIKQSLKRDLEKWSKSLQQRSEAGKKSAEKRANEKQRKATTVESRSTNSTVSVNDSVSVNVSDSVTDSNIKDLPAIAEEYIFKLPTNKNNEFYLVTQQEVDTYKFTYLAVDVEQQYKSIISWLSTNSKNRKTKSGMPRFINSWLSKAQNSASRVNATQQRPVSNTEFFK